MTITVFGMPKPQGSKRFVGVSKAGRGILVESCKEVKSWREAVKHAALDVGEHVAGAVDVEMVFTMPKPKSAPKNRRTWPDRKPDIDKLCRSTLDALRDAGCIEDDARVIRLSAMKVFPGEYVDSLRCPGAMILIRGVAEVWP